MLCIGDVTAVGDEGIISYLKNTLDILESCKTAKTRCHHEPQSSKMHGDRGLSYQGCQQLIRCHLCISFPVHLFLRFSDFVYVERGQHWIGRWKNGTMVLLLPLGPHLERGETPWLLRGRWPLNAGLTWALLAAS